VLVVSDSVHLAVNGHALPPSLLAVEFHSPQQSGLFNKAQTLFSWGTEHVWIIGPFEQEYFEYHGGEQFTKVTSELRTGTLLLSIPALRLASTL
jgi:Uma2 family endonuclease